MTERLCICCPHLRHGEPRVYDRAHVCDGCRSRLRTILGDIHDGYRHLAAELIPGQGQAERVSGSREAPLPLRVNPLDLTMPPRLFHPTPESKAHPEDWAGYLGVASRLDSWVRDWRDTLRPQEGLPRPNVRHLTAWLGNRLPDACDHHPAINDFAHEMRELLGDIRRTTGVTEVRPEHLDVPCRRCDLLDLHRLPGQDRVECASCGDLLTEDEYHRWVGILSAAMKEPVA